MKKLEELPLTIDWDDQCGETVTCYLVIHMKCENCLHRDECKLEVMKASGIHNKRMKLIEVSREALIADEAVCAIQGISKTLYSDLSDAALTYVKRLFEAMGIAPADSITHEEKTREELKELRKQGRYTDA